MSKKQPNHHELPKLYLRAFCESGTSFVWVFQRGAPFLPGLKRGRHNPLRSGLRETGLRKDNYAVRPPSKRLDYSYETKLQQEEHKADLAINKIRRCDALDRVDKDIIAHYIGMMRKRLTRRDVEATSILDEQIRQYPWDELQRQLAYAGRFGSALQVPQAKEHFLSEYGRTKLLRESMLQPFGRAHEALMNMNWSFRIAPQGEYFITSDNPVVFDEGAGLLNSSLLFPISQQVLLLATWTKGTDLSYVGVAADEVRKLNSLVVITATKEIYSPKPDEWIHQGWEYGFKWP